MNTPTDASYDSTTAATLDEVMKIACRLAGRDAIGGIYVAINERPTYNGLLHYRRMAEAFGLTLTLYADTIVLHPRCEPESERSEYVHALTFETLLPDARQSPVHVWRAARGRRSVESCNLWTLARRWLHAQKVSWNAGFQGPSEEGR